MATQRKHQKSELMDKQKGMLECFCIATRHMGHMIKSALHDMHQSEIQHARGRKQTHDRKAAKKPRSTAKRK